MKFTSCFVASTFHITFELTTLLNFMMKYCLLICCLVLCLFACKRRGEPVPKICPQGKEVIDNKVTIKLTDTLILVNCSERFTKLRWEMPDGGTSTQETVFYVPSTIGIFDAHLFVSNNDFVNEYEAVQQIEVIP